jgi:putative MATE family efflux protein
MNSNSKLISFFRLVRQAIRGEEENFTEGSINRAIFLLSLPMVLEMAMESLFAVVDIFYVSRLNNTDAVSAIGLTESILTIIYSIAIGLSMGATAMVARRIGEKNKEGAAIAAIQSLYIGFAAALIFSVAGFFFHRDLLTMMGATEGILSTGANYAKWMLIGNFSVMLLFLFNAIYRGTGNAAMAMRALWLSNILNIILDPIFIFGLGPIPSFGVEGAAIATNIGRTIGVAYQVYYMFSGKGILKVNRSHLVVRLDIIKRLLKVSAGGTAQFLIGSASWIFLVKIMANFGSAALAGYTIAIRVIIFTILPSWGLANAAATLVGQNLGAGQPDRAEKSVWRTGYYNMAFLGLVMIVFLVSSRPILNFFTDDKEVIDYGTNCLQIIALGYLFYGYGMVITQSFNGAGDTRTPTILNLIFFWLVQIPLAYLLSSTFGFGANGVFSAVPIAETALAITGIIIFKKGKWKEMKI